MFIHSFRVRNYSVHRDTKIALKPVSVFVGANGAGKSALFDAMLNFSMVARGRLGQVFGPFPYSYEATKSRGSPETEKISFEVVLSAEIDSAEQITYKIAYWQANAASVLGPATFAIVSETLMSNTRGLLFDRDDASATPLGSVADYLSPDMSFFAGIRKTDAAVDDVLVTEIAQKISRINKFRLDPGVLAQPSFLPDSSRDAPRVEYDGGNLAATLYALSETDRDVFELISSKIRSVIPACEAIDFNAVGAGKIGYGLRFSDARQTVTAPRLSDGQRLIVGLTTLIYSPNRPSVILIEEPENGLTAPAQRALYQAIRDLGTAADPSERVQVMLSSHSPFVLVEAWNGEDRDFVFQVQVEGGKARTRTFSEVVAASGQQLRKTQDGRLELGLSNAEQMMSGYLSQQ